eukprot:SAG11_NODE_4065_length_2082_cov_1.178013_2_plen_60_part_00
MHTTGRSYNYNFSLSFIKIVGDKPTSPTKSMCLSPTARVSGIRAEHTLLKMSSHPLGVA